jgi:hypothetical protein
VLSAPNFKCKKGYRSSRTKRAGGDRQGEHLRLRNRLAPQKCREKKKAYIADLMERANAKQPYEIERKMVELQFLRAIVLEHCRVCPKPSWELMAWFEKELSLTDGSK